MISGKIKRQKVYTVSIALCSFLFVSIIIGQLLNEESIVTDWKIDVVGIDQMIRVGEVHDFHMFLEDGAGRPITDADITVTFDMPEMVHHLKKDLKHVANGLYQTENIFSMGGTWIGIVEVKRGKEEYYNQFFFNVEGPIISKGYRDPGDHIDMKQPLPAWVERQFQ